MTNGDLIEKHWREKVENNVPVPTIGDAISRLREYEVSIRESTYVPFSVHAAFLAVFRHFEQYTNEEPQPEQNVNVKKVLAFADALDAYAKEVNSLPGTTIMHRAVHAEEMQAFAYSLRKCVESAQQEDDPLITIINKTNGHFLMYEGDELVLRCDTYEKDHGLQMLTVLGFKIASEDMRDERLQRLPHLHRESLKELREDVAGYNKRQREEEIAELRERLAELEAQQ